VFIESKKSRIGLRLLELVDQELDGIHRAHGGEDTPQHEDLLQIALGRYQKLFLAGAGFEDVDRREHALVGNLAVKHDFAVAGALEFFEDDLVHRLPVSISAVAMMVSEPPSSMLRAAPKKRFGRCSALASTPPVSTLPEDGTTVL
jgi:hypothetical protein